METPKPRTPRFVTLAALIVYLALIVPAAVSNVERVNPDGISYICLARNLSEGRLFDSVSSWWSPLISWCIAPLLAVGVDGLAAARIVLAAWGAVLLVGAIALARRLSDLRAPWSLLPALLIALAAVFRAIRVISPDVIVAACLMLYFHATLHPRLLESRWRQFACGLLGGVAFLAKAYALPFVLVHFTFVLLLRRRLERATRDGAQADAREPGRREPLKAWAAGMFGLALLAAPWIGLISYKDARITISSAGPGTHARQASELGRWPPMDRLRAPLPGHLHTWETPEAFTSDVASSREGGFLAYQAGVAYRGVWNAGRVISQFDRLHVSFYLVLALPLIALALRSRRDDLLRGLWMLGTVALYCSGYALIVVRERFIEPVLLPPVCIASFHFAGVLAARLSAWKKKISLAVGGLAAAVLVISFGHTAVGRLAANRTLTGQPSTYRALARELLAKGHDGPVASTCHWPGLYVAYHMGRPYLGKTASDKLAECEAELDEHGAKMFLVWNDSPLYAVFATSPSWTRVVTGAKPDTHSDRRLDVYVRRF